MDKGLAHRPRLAGNLDTKEGNGWREDPRQWATGQAAQLTGVKMCNAGARCQTWRRMLLGAINLYLQHER